MYIVEWSYPDENGNMVYKSESFNCKRFADMYVSVLKHEQLDLNSVTLSEVDE